MIPRRIQRKRTKGWRMPENTVSVCRPGRWGNPHVVGPDLDAQEAVEAFERDLVAGTLSFTIEDVQAELKGRNIACWCNLADPCHGDVYLKYANQDPEHERFTFRALRALLAWRQDFFGMLFGMGKQSVSRLERNNRQETLSQKEMVSMVRFIDEKNLLGEYVEWRFGLKVSRRWYKHGTPLSGMKYIIKNSHPLDDINS